MKVEIYSDVACPWCYIGKRRFEKALAAYSGSEAVEVVMRPFQLDATLSPDPAAAVPAEAHYVKKFGPQFPAMQARVAEVAKGEGIEYRADRMRVTNTFDAHRLAWLAEQEGGPALARRVNDALFAAYFTEGRVVSDPEALVAIGAEAGLDPARVRAYLASDEGVEPVKALLREAQGLGVSAVPTFVFEGQWAVSGAQEVATFLQVLESVERERAAAGDPDAEGACEA